MTATLADYWQAVDTFAAEMDRLGDDLRSLLLWGSLARGVAVPGQSDLIDVLVVVRRGLLADAESFDRVVGQILAACAPLAASDLPFDHPPLLYEEGELGDFDGVYGPDLASPVSSRHLRGEDLRRSVSWEGDAQAVARCALFSLRRRFMDRLAVFLPPLKLSESHQILLFQRLVGLTKALPAMVCAAFGRPASLADALDRLRQLLPDLDTTFFTEVAALRRGERTLASPEELQDLLRRAFDLGERIDERLLESGAAPWSELLAEG